MIFAVFDPSPLTVCINCSFLHLLTVLIMSSLTRFVQQVIPFIISSHRIGQMIFVSEVILFSCLITVLICIKNPLLFDPCISISNKLILVFSYIALCVYCFYVISMFHFYCTVMYVDVRLTHPNKDYLLTYLCQ